MRVTKRLAIAMDPRQMFQHCVGSPPDEWQAKLLVAMAKAANDRTVTPRRFWVGCSRQSGKSCTVAVAATWLGAFSTLAGRPIVIVSASERQAMNLANLVRRNLQMLGDDLALRVTHENASEIHLANGTIYVALPGGSGGDTLRSYSAIGALIADEAGFCDTETFSAVFPMTSVSRGLIVLLSSANGRENLFGRLEAERDPAWSYTKVTALECPRLDAETLEAEKRALGRWRFRREYLVDFDAGVEDSFFSPEAIAAAVKPANEIPPFRGGL